MEYEVEDEPQGIDEDDEANRDGGLIEDHIALKNQSSVDPEDYPSDQRQNSSLVQPDRNS